MKKWFLFWLMTFLSPHIDEDFEIVPDEPTDEPADEPTDEPADEPTDEPADEPTDDEPAPAPRISRAQQTIIETRQRAQKAERELAAAQAELAASRRGPAAAAQPTQDQVLWNQEEEALRNPEATDWQRYAIQANRSARAAQAASQSALQRSEDMADRSAFSAIAATKPKVYAAYKDRVEERLAEIRKTGGNAPREAVLAILLGKDMLDGKVKSSTTKAAKPAAPRASVRSDVTASGGGRMTEHEKRAKRLENVRI